MHQDNAGHMTKMAAMPIFGKIDHFKNHVPGSTGLILMKLYEASET